MQNNNGNAKQKDWVLFQFQPDNPKAIKIDFSGNVNLENGAKGTILGVKGQSKDGNTKFIKVFAQVGVIFKGDDKFTGEMNYSEAGGHKGLIGWLNEQGTILSGYKNEPRPKQPKAESKEIPF
ncbi:MAG: hypothetical protein HKN86_01400 [Acidimicrobiia bacterium]|nr:hypothetical protein [Acidimicrobiia bacterium]